MRPHLRLAFRAWWFHRTRSVLLAASLAAVLLSSLGFDLVFRAGSKLLQGRARATPLLFVPPGSAVDQVLSALYFESAPASLRRGALRTLEAAGLADIIPVYVRFTARGAPVVGTTVDYFARRELHFAEGRPFGLLGEAVAGANAARHLALAAGASIITDRESPFDLTATLPLKLDIVGVLAPTGGPDDDAIFVDLKTSWVIEGRGHGHGATDPANPIPQTHQHITADNRRSFHFHGDQDENPLSAALVWPHDDRARVLLRARHDERDPTVNHFLVPAEVVGRLLERAFRVEAMLFVASLVSGFGALVLLVLVISLSLTQRRRELETLARIGVAKGAVVELLAWELVFTLGPAVVIAAGLLGVLSLFGQDLWLAVLRGG